MITFRYAVKNRQGIHARPACLLMKEAKKYQSKITVQKGEREASAVQLLGLMSLSIKGSDEIIIKIDGADEEIAGQGLKKFLEENI